MTDADPAEETLPIDPDEPMAMQSRHCLMVADEETWRLSYRWPVDMRQPDQVQQLRNELGPDAELPTDDGAYYLVYVTPRVGDPFPILLPEGEVRSSVFMAAALESREAAARVRYKPGILPR